MGWKGNGWIEQTSSVDVEGSNEIQRSHIAVPIRKLVKMSPYLNRVGISKVSNPSLTNPLQIRFNKKLPSNPPLLPGWKQTCEVPCGIQ